MYERMSAEKLGGDDASPEGENMKNAVLAVKDAIEKFVGHECDIAIGVHFHTSPEKGCSAMVITPDGMSIELASKTLWLALGGLQQMLAEMASPGDTIN